MEKLVQRGDAKGCPLKLARCETLGVGGTGRKAFTIRRAVPTGAATPACRWPGCEAPVLPAQPLAHLRAQDPLQRDLNHVAFRTSKTASLSECTFPHTKIPPRISKYWLLEALRGSGPMLPTGAWGPPGYASRFQKNSRSSIS